MKSRTLDDAGSIFEVVEKQINELDIRNVRGNPFCKDEYFLEISEIVKQVNYESSVEQITEIIKTVFYNESSDESRLIETAQSIHDGITVLKRLESFEMELKNKVHIMPRRDKRVVFFWRGIGDSVLETTRYYLGTLSDSLVFTPDAAFFELSEEERNALKFPDNWDISAITDSGCRQD